VEKLRTHTIPIYVYIYICKYVGTGGWLSWKKDVCVVKDRGLNKGEDKRRIYTIQVYIYQISTPFLYICPIYTYMYVSI